MLNKPVSRVRYGEAWGSAMRFSIGGVVAVAGGAGGSVSELAEATG